MARQGQQPSRYRGVTSTVAAAALVLYAITIGLRPAAPPTSILGSYKVQVAGYGKGTGTCTVGAKTVDVNCVIRDVNGNSQTLSAASLKLDGYRFKGNGTLDGMNTRISGRIDPPTAKQPLPRLLATFVADDGRTGRVLGKHE